jgi:peptidoglycan/xylan/chitin deacetylase (PgdA/CDA1 family)
MKKIRNIVAYGIAHLIIGLGFSRRIKKKALNGEFILSIYFHAPSKKLFEFCVQWLVKNNFNILSQEDVLNIAKKNKPFPKGSVILTVDDGWQSNEDNIVAIANKYKIPVTIFISTEPVVNGNFWWPYVENASKAQKTNYSIEALKKMPNEERKEVVEEIKKIMPLKREAMTVDQIKNIAEFDLVTIGAHTVSHPILPNCEDHEAHEELKNSKETIEKWILKNVNSFAYPNGDYGEREIKYLKELGYSLAYTTKSEYLTPQKLNHVYELPRFCIYENVTNAEAICRMLGLWQRIFSS